MKTHVVLAEDWQLMKDAVQVARDYLKVLNVVITTERKNVDVSSEYAYETNNSWSGLIIKKTKSLTAGYILGQASAKYQEASCVGVMVDLAKVKSDPGLKGQQSTLGDKQAIEVYCAEKGKKHFGFKDRATYTLVHEIMHALADHYDVKDSLHNYVDDDKNKNLDAYVQILLDRITKSPMGLLPVVQKAADKLVEHAKALGTPIRIVEGYRSPERQNELYNKKPKVTNAKAWESMHQYRVAFDIVFRNEGYNATDAQWKALVDYAKTLKLEWGGNWSSFPDKPHFEMTLGKKLKDFQTNNIDWTLYYSGAVEKWTRDLSLGSQGEDVRELQRWLNANGFQVAKTGPGSPGKETDYYGPATTAAVVKLQKVNKILPAEGYFGPITRKKLNEI